MRLTNHKDQGLHACLAALKTQQRALARSIEEVRQLLEGLEAADDAELTRATQNLGAAVARGLTHERRYGRRQEQSASPQQDRSGF